MCWVEGNTAIQSYTRLLRVFLGRKECQVVLLQYLGSEASLSGKARSLRQADNDSHDVILLRLTMLADCFNNVSPKEMAKVNGYLKALGCSEPLLPA